MITLDFDVAVLGAGSSGAATALFLALAGRRVALLEARTLAHAGACWIDDVPPWMFDRAGIDRPQPPDKTCDHVPLTMLGPSGWPRVPIGLRPMWGMDMRALTSRLRRNALASGVRPFEKVVIDRVVERQGRAVELLFHGRETERDACDYRLAARLFVDATGTRQALLRRVPTLSACCPPLAPTDICTAIQQVRVVADRDGARDFVARHGVENGHVLCFMGVQGGYSSLMVRVEPDGDHVEVLAGVAGGAKGKRGEAVLHQFLAAQRWIGAAVFGGSGRIPIRRPYDRLAAEGIALVGDSACQAFPQHGSGVGAGLVAARMLADAVRHVDDPGSAAATWAYQAAFHRERGGVHAAYDVLRRAAQRLDGNDLAALMAGGVVDPATTRAALDQQLPPVSASTTAALALRAARMPRRSLRLVAAAARMPLIAKLYARYPLAHDERALRRWAMAAAALCGHWPDG